MSKPLRSSNSLLLIVLPPGYKRGSGCCSKVLARSILSFSLDDLLHRSKHEKEDLSKSIKNIFLFRAIEF